MRVEVSIIVETETSRGLRTPYNKHITAIKKFNTKKQEFERKKEKEPQKSPSKCDNKKKERARDASIRTEMPSIRDRDAIHPD
jgi:hypothetical protein